MTVSKSVLIAGFAVIAGIALGFILGRSGDAHALADAPEAPAYLVVMGTVHDREAFFSGYVANLPPLYERHGGSYLAVTGDVETMEGDIGFESVVMSVWPNADAARAFWNDPDYRALADARIDGRWGDFDVFLVEGLPAAPASE